MVRCGALTGGLRHRFFPLTFSSLSYFLHRVLLCLPFFWPPRCSFTSIFVVNSLSFPSVFRITLFISFIFYFLSKLLNFLYLLVITVVHVISI
jgi:hypothetical protein